MPRERTNLLTSSDVSFVNDSFIFEQRVDSESD